MKTSRSLIAILGLISGAQADTANTAAVVSAANAFMAPLTTAQKTAIDGTSANINTSVLYNGPGTTNGLANVGVWSNLPTSGTRRNGLRMTELSTTNQTNALAIATAALSTSGKQLLDDVRAADRFIAGESTNRSPSGNANSSMWGYGKYYTAFVGSPSTTAPWTYQFGGHHLAYNITYNGTYTSGMPIFAGTEPNSFTDNTGTYAPLGKQRTAILALRSGGTYTPVHTRLDGTQTAVTAGAITTSALLSGTYSGVVMGPSPHDTTFPKSYPTTGRGQLYSTLTAAQQVVVVDYIKVWVSYLHPTIADEMLAIYLSPQALAETYIGYAGSSATLATSGNYFRIDGPRCWIEFSVEGGVYLSGGVHDHGVVRDKLADYGAAYGSTTISTTVRPPSITTQPSNQSAAAGGSATFSVVAASTGTGTATLSYQWLKDGSAISGATSASYAISGASAANVGSYQVQVISTGGLVTSNAATFSLTASSPAIDTSSTLPGETVGYAYSQTLTASGGTSPYTWTLDSGTLPTNLALGTSGLISGTPNTAGTFNFTAKVTDSASATATKAFTVTVIEPLTLFLNTYGLTDASADDDHDGVSNLLEFFFGGDPTVADGSSTLPIGTYNRSAATFTYTFHIPEIDGSISWLCQYTGDLATWIDAVNGTNGVTIQAGTAVDGDVPVTVTIPTTSSRIFARVKVTGP
ncbi:DUF3500 domain-containing protein [Luteolibacter soli]|uniref:DUF3500 domain-containing protein n=1 Tax=Luteolibacter soli TaxID=3135280 RepID=A0ABU9B1E1_9BACT